MPADVAPALLRPGRTRFLPRRVSPEGGCRGRSHRPDASGPTCTHTHWGNSRRACNVPAGCPLHRPAPGCLLVHSVPVRERARPGACASQRRRESRSLRRPALLPGHRRRRRALRPALAGQAEVVLAGEGPVEVAPGPSVHVLSALGGKGAAIRAALSQVTGAVTVLQDPDDGLFAGRVRRAGAAPSATDTADAVFGRRPRACRGDDGASAALGGTHPLRHRRGAGGSAHRPARLPHRGAALRHRSPATTTRWTRSWW